MSLLQRKRAKVAAKTNDLSTITWTSLSQGLGAAESLVGRNAQIRYGIATETDIGLPETKSILVPVTDAWEGPAELQKMYESTVLMSGIHAVVNKSGNHIVAPFPTSDKLSRVAEIEWMNRTELKDVALDDNDEYSLFAMRQHEDSATLTAICAHLNYLQFKDTYPEIVEGAVIAGAHAVAMAYRTGILESYAGREYIFVQVKYGNDGSYSVVNIDPSYAKRDVRPIKPGLNFPPGTLQLHPKLVELGLGLCIGSGTTHYMMNHTTGGSSLNGHNLKALAINNLYEIDPGHGRPSEQKQTDFIYNVVHPVCKRAVANLVLQNSKVTCWHKNVYLLNPTVIYSDTFMAYRQNLVPSGAHKAYIAALVLRDITQAGLGVFLPDQDLCRKVIQIYKDIQDLGARAHVGSRYYTDFPPAISQSEVDAFMPLAAYYVQFKMTNSSIAASPHLSPEVADSANPAWKAIIDSTVRSGALGAPAEQIAAYLSAAGAMGYKVELATPEGRNAAIKINNDLATEINDLF